MREVENYCVGCETCIHCGRDRNVEIYTCDICNEQILGDVTQEDDENGRNVDLCETCAEKLDFLASFIDHEPYSTFVEMLKIRPKFDIEDSGEVAEIVSRYYQKKVTTLNIKLAKLKRGENEQTGRDSRSN